MQKNRRAPSLRSRRSTRARATSPLPSAADGEARRFFCISNSTPHVVTPATPWLRQIRLRNSSATCGYATVTPNSRHMVTPVTPRLRQIRLRHMVTPRIVTPVTTNTVTPHSYAICGYAVSRRCDFDRDSASSLSGQKLP